MDSFTNQMRYNIILCKINQGEKEDAKDIVKQIKIDIDQPFYGDFISFKKWVGEET